MKKVKFDKSFRLYREETKQKLHCPLSQTDQVEILCGPWCAWFDIEIRERDSSAGIAEAKFITCKGTPIGELVEEEVGE